MYKKIFSLMLVCVMSILGVACNTTKKSDNPTPQISTPGSFGELEILKSDKTLTQEQRLSKIKGDYLLENKGYKEGDEIVAIVQLKQPALIDGYLENNSTWDSVADYATSQGGNVNAKNIARKQSDLINQLYARGLVKSVNYSYSTIINAISVTTTYSDLKKIASLEDVQNTILSDTFNRPQAVDKGSVSKIINNVDVYPTGIFNSASVSFTGKGTAVAILDSGFDCSHSVFANQPTDLWIKKDKVKEILPKSKAMSFTENIELSDVWYSDKIPFVYDYADKDSDVFPYNSEHGTHVAGIIGGKDQKVTGVAVDTQLVLLKVFPDLDDGAKTEDILAALEDAVLLGVDCINMSLGSSCGFAREADNEAINNVYDKIFESGISLITAASNSYSSGFGGAQGNTNFVTNPDSGTVGSPSTYAAALSVASISGTKSRYLLGNDEQVIFFNESNSITGKHNDFVAELGIGEGQSKEYDYVTVPGSGLKINYKTLDVKGKIALVRRGNNTFEEKAMIAKNEGAIACIIYNNIDGDILMSMGKSDHIPTISISKDSGTMLAQRESGKIVIDYSYQAGPFMSDFSSWGPSPNLEIKPEITAHGGNIYSAIPGGGYDELSGTSMASPNMCGIVVLIRQYLKEKFPSYTHKQISTLCNQLLMSTASIVVNEEGTPYSPRKQGAGLASLYNVVNTPAYITVDNKDKTKLELKDDPKRTGKYEMTFNVVNFSTSDATYTLSLASQTESISTFDKKHVAETGNILSNNYTADVISGEGSINKGKVSVKANSELKIKLTYTLSAQDKNLIDSLFPYGMFVEGFVKLTAEGEKAINLNVPFLAFYGDWTQAPMFDKTYYEVDPEAKDASISEEDKLKADYFATTPYGSYFYNYIIPLGTYLYDIDTQKYDAIPASEEHIAISNVFGAMDGFSSVYAGLLRNAKKMTYTITDKITGDVVWTYVDENARKAYSLGGGPVPYFDYINLKAKNLTLTNNRKYEFRMQGVLDYGDGGVATNVRNYFAFDFTFDNEAPVVKSATYTKTYDESLKKDRYYVNLSVYDNHYVQSVYPIIFTSESSYTFLTDGPIPVYSTKGANNNVKIEITSFLEDIYADKLITNAIAFSIDDYALNSNIFVCQLPGTRGDFKFTKDGRIDGGDKLVVTVEEGKLVDLTQYLATADKSVDESKDYLKYLVWESSNEQVAVANEGLVLGVHEGRTMVTVTETMNLKQARVFINVVKSTTATPTKSTVKSTAKDAINLSDAKIQSLRFSYFETLFAYSRAAQTSKIGKTGDRVFLSELPSGISFYPGEKIQLFYDFDPWYAKDKYALSYQSSNEKVAIVDENGVVTALKKGVATITLKVEGSPIMASVRLTVNSEFIIEDRTLIAYKGLGGKVVIPDDEGILYIGAYSFCLYTTDNTIELPEDDYDANKIPATNTSVTSVVIPKGVEEIRKYAFYNCSGLKEVQLPDTVKIIAEYAFCDDVKLDTINLENITTIGREAFNNCKALKTINTPKTFAIGKLAFADCIELAYIDLTSLRNAGEEIFNTCTNLKSVKLGKDTKLSYGMFAFSGLQEVELLEKVQIPENIFYGCESLEKVTLPDNDIAFGANIFYNCKSLKEVIFKDNTNIVKTESAIFAGTALEKFTVPTTSKYYKTTEDNKLLLNKSGDTLILRVVKLASGEDTTLTLPDNIKNIGTSAFSGCEIEKLVITNKDLVISESAFENCPNLVEVQLPTEGVVEIGEGAFADCKKLEVVTNLDKVKKVGDYAFTSTAIKTLTTAENSEYGEGAFFQSKVEQVTIGKGTKFALGAFQKCLNLKEVNMPEGGGVTFGVACFALSPALETIDLSTVKIIENQTFYGCTSLKGANLLNATKIGSYAFADCSSLGFVTFPKVTSIGEGAFSRNQTSGGGAPIISEVTLPKTLKSLGQGVFIGCEGLTEVIFEAQLTQIDDFTFAYCKNLYEIELPQSVTKIGVYSFAGCEILNKVNTANIKEFGAYAFTSCTELEKIDITSAEKIGYGAFASTSVTGDIVANSLTNLGDYAFQNAKLNSFVASNLTQIGEAAFQGNKNLKEFVFSSEVEKVGAYAFQGCEKLAEYYVYINGEKIQNYDNKKIKLLDGILYSYMPSGRLMLSSVPMAKEIVALEVLEGTYRIETYAGNENKNVKVISLPDSLKLIGNYAFYGYDKLLKVEFRSIQAPVLENSYSKNAKLVEGDFGYELLHSQFNMFGLEMCYYNFVDLLGKKKPVEMLLPQNEDIVGYDTLVYEGFFGKADGAQRTNYIAKDKNLSALIDYAYELQKVKDIVIGNETLINNAVTAYNALKQSGLDYGYTQEEWDALIKVVLDAKDKLHLIKRANAGITINKLQALIDSLPDEYSRKWLNTLNDITAQIDNLTVSEKALIDMTRYTALLAKYNQSPLGYSVSEMLMITLIPSGVLLVLIGVGVAVAIILIKKKKRTPQPQPPTQEIQAPQEKQEIKKEQQEQPQITQDTNTKQGGEDNEKTE